MVPSCRRRGRTDDDHSGTAAQPLPVGTHEASADVSGLIDRVGFPPDGSRTVRDRAVVAVASPGADLSITAIEPWIGAGI